MLRALFLGVMLAIAAVLPRSVVAYSEAELFLPFDASSLTWQERRFLQAALAFSGDYNGLLDGDWGGNSQRALESYTRRVDAPNRPQNWVAVFLALEALGRIDAEGWEIVRYESLGLSFLEPLGNMTRGSQSEHFFNYEHLGSTLSYSLRVSAAPEMVRMHDYTRARTAAEPYAVRRDSRWITKTTDAAGVTLYTRSERVAGLWSTIMLSAAARDLALLDAVAASISVRRAVPLILPQGGRLSAGIYSLSAMMDRNGPAIAGDLPRSPSGESPAVSNAPESSSSGTGFFVSAAGHMLTNAHVVEGCRSITVDGEPVTVLAEDDSFDLALLQTGQRPAEFAVFAAAPAQLNSDIVVAGYPLRDILSDLNVTRGSITANRGIRGDITRMQISAPVQPGNSGGPVLSAQGTIVGVVVSKLDAGRVAELTGDIPQNINFAVRGEMAQFFLVQNGVTPVTATGIDSLAPEMLARNAAAFTRLIECH